MNEELIFRFLNWLFVEKKYSKNTFFSYKTDLYQFLNFLNKKINKITVEDVKKYFDNLKILQINSSTLARKYSTLNTFFKFLIINNVIESNPLEFIDYPKISKKLPEYLTPVEIEKFLNAISTKTNEGIRDRALFELMYSTGLRVSEVVNLLFTNIDLKNNILKVEGKGNKERIVPFGSICNKYITKYLSLVRPDINKKNLPFLFVSRRGDKLSRITIWKNIKKYSSLAGIKKNVYPHILRHSFATHLISNGADIRFVQELLGHESILTTEIYTHLDIGTIIEFYNKFTFRK